MLSSWERSLPDVGTGSRRREGHLLESNQPIGLLSRLCGLRRPLILGRLPVRNSSPLGEGCPKRILRAALHPALAENE
jgi:hypothetical protein